MRTSAGTSGEPVYCSVGLTVSDGYYRRSCRTRFTIALCKRDCAGTINGTKVYDACGVCVDETGTPGSSCICNVYNLADKKFGIDIGAYSEYFLVRVEIRLLEKTRRKTAVEALARKYPSQEAAFRGIKKYIKEYYAEYFGDAVLERKVALDKAVAAAQAIYSRNIFPSMNVNWLTYPGNTGHRTSPGCFRCHDGRFKTEDGRVLESACGKCHKTSELKKWGEHDIEDPARICPGFKGVESHMRGLAVIRKK